MRGRDIRPGLDNMIWQCALGGVGGACGGRLRIYQGSFTHKVAVRAQGAVVNNILRLFCVHKICGQTCKEERVPESIARIVPELQKIAEKNDGQDTRMDSLLQSISELFRKEKL